MKTQLVVAIAMLVGAQSARADVAGNCLPEYQECQGTKGFTTNPQNWNYKIGTWRVVQIMNGYGIYASEGHARFRIALNLKSVEEYGHLDFQKGWSLDRSLRVPGSTDPLCMMFDSELQMQGQDGFPVTVRAFWAHACPKELQK